MYHQSSYCDVQPFPQVQSIQPWIATFSLACNLYALFYILCARLMMPGLPSSTVSAILVTKPVTSCPCLLWKETSLSKRLWKLLAETFFLSFKITLPSSASSYWSAKNRRIISISTKVPSYKSSIEWMKVSITFRGGSAVCPCRSGIRSCQNPLSDIHLPDSASCRIGQLCSPHGRGTWSVYCVAAHSVNVWRYCYQ